MTMKKKIYDNPADNAAYLQGFFSGRRADGEDWVRSELEKGEEKAAKELAWKHELCIAVAAQGRIDEVIQEKQMQINALESEKEYWKSVALAYQVSLRALVGEDLERGRRL